MLILKAAIRAVVAIVNARHTILIGLVIDEKPIESIFVGVLEVNPEPVLGEMAHPAYCDVSVFEHTLGKTIVIPRPPDVEVVNSPS